MTEEVKDIIIGKMIDRPEELTAEEISQILSDAELKELYGISAKLSEEFYDLELNLKHTDVEMEWNRLRGLIAKRNLSKRRIRWWVSIAAGIAAILICGGILLKNNPMERRHGVSAIRIAKVEVNNEQIVEIIDSEKQEAKHELSASARRVGYTISKGVQRPPVPQAEAIGDELDERLRIEEARIDNEVAMALARVYQEEHSMNVETMAEYLIGLPLDNDAYNVQYVDNSNINQITML